MKETTSPNQMTSPKLKLQSKKLKSGKVQVKFSVSSPASDNCYGYVLTDAETTLKEVVKGIQSELSLLEDVDRYYHHHLYALNRSKFDLSQFMIFRAH